MAQRDPQVQFTPAGPQNQNGTGFPVPPTSAHLRE